MPKRSRYVATTGCLVLLLTAAWAGGIADAKKKKGSRGPAQAVVTETVNLPVPDNTMGGFNGVLYSTLEIGKKFKGKTIGDVNLTIQTVGLHAESADDFRLRLTAPNGATVPINPTLIGASVGPLTYDDETMVRTCNDPTPPCFDPDLTLGPPYAGTASADPLYLLDGGPMRGTWRLRVSDVTDVGETNLFSLWRITVTPERPGE
jgi:subtilisin-like proprotein convertase family protein